MTIKCRKTSLVKKNIFQNLHAIKSYISAHQSPVRGYDLAYNRTPKHTRGIISRGVYNFDCYTGGAPWIHHC